MKDDALRLVLGKIIDANDITISIQRKEIRRIEEQLLESKATVPPSSPRWKPQVIYGHFGTTDPAEPSEIESAAQYASARISQPDIGLDADDPLFWLFAGQAPIATDAGDPLPLDDQVEWALARTRAYHATVMARKLGEVTLSDSDVIIKKYINYLEKENAKLLEKLAQRTIASPARRVGMS